MDAAFALEVLDKAPYITVSFTRPDGTPYGVPLSLARTDDKTFYFHCALEGEKLDCIAANPRVALSAVTRCTPIVGTPVHVAVALTKRVFHCLSVSVILLLNIILCAILCRKDTFFQRVIQIFCRFSTDFLYF